MVWTGKIKQIDDVRWEIPQDYKRGMRVPVRIYADAELLNEMRRDMTLEQATNVSFLQGIYKYSIALPDGHQGYGFPIGGVAATDAETGVISPGGVGYDINCGVRLLYTNLEKKISSRNFVSWSRPSSGTCHPVWAVEGRSDLLNHNLTRCSRTVLAGESKTALGGRKIWIG